MATRKSTGGPRPTTLNWLEAAMRRCFGCRVDPEPDPARGADPHRHGYHHRATIDPPAGGSTRHICCMDPQPWWTARGASTPS